VERILATAYTGFMAAKADSYTAGREGVVPAVVIHTGHWGTGSFGGNKALPSPSFLCFPSLLTFSFPSSIFHLLSLGHHGLLANSRCEACRYSSLSSFLFLLSSSASSF